MKTIRHNGEYWYEDRRSLWLRLRNWVIWIGGWERTDHKTGKHEWRPVTRWSDPFPLSLLGRCVTFFPFGVDVRLRRTHFHWHYRKSPGSYGPLGMGYAYCSRDGTPRSADHWLWGWERSGEWSEIRRSVQAQEAEREAREKWLTGLRAERETTHA